jgi:elongation factor 1-beta
MGDVAIRIRVMPESTDINLDQLKESIRSVIPAKARLHAIEEKPIAFGLKALIVVAIQNDKLGGTDEIEAAIAKVSGVESVEVEEVGLL